MPHTSPARQAVASMCEQGKHSTGNSRLRLWFLVATFFLVVAAASGCDSSSGNTVEQDRTSSPCSILSRSDVAALLGGTVTTSSRPGECTYLSKPGVYMVLDIASGVSALASAKRLWTEYGQSAGTVIGSLDGTSTLWTAYPSGAGGGGRLVAIRGGKVIEVSVTMGVSDPLATARRGMTIAFKSLSRSPRS